MSARPVAHRSIPSRPKTPRAATGLLARYGAARFRGGPVASRQWCGPCMCVGGGGPARRKVDGSADDIALNSYCLELSEGKPPIADQRFVVRQLLVGPLEQASL